jgi:hypothetical protein
MSATNTFEDALLGLLFENSAVANVGDASGLQPSATAGSFYISLHTASPAETDSNQTVDEATYTSYARVAVARNSSNWTVSAGVADNDNAISFPTATGGSNTISHFGIGSALSGTGNLQMYGALSSNLAVSNNITPEFAAGALDVTMD